MNKKLLKGLKFLLVLILFFSNSLIVAFAEENNNYILSLEKDGYWKPSDSVSSDFYVINIWGEEGYLDSLSFNNTYIKDKETNKEYTVDEAVNMGIIEGYSIELSIINKDNSLKKIFTGTMKELEGNKIHINDKIYMYLDTKVKFNMKISLDKKADNKYQNKSYEYLFSPSAYRIKTFEEYNGDGSNGVSEEDLLNKKENNNSIFSKTGDFQNNLAIVVILIMIFSIFVYIRINKRK